MYLERPVNAQKMMEGSIKALQTYDTQKEATESTSTGGN
jgi:hypothetical protein